MSRSFEDARRWMQEGQALFDRAVDGLTEADLDADTPLPGWTRRHLVAHVAANADALGNLVSWAATGVETPMYASVEERAAGIERGARLPADELLAWQRRAAAALASGLDALDEEHLGHRVRTAQGREVPAAEVGWMRSREVMVHAVDANRGISFADLPTDFLASLVEDIVAKRGDVPTPDGPRPELAAWLAGRPHRLDDAPALGPWL